MVAGKEAHLPACVPPCMGSDYGLLVAGGRTVPAANSAADQYCYTCPHVLLLLYVLNTAAAAMEEAGNSVPDHPIFVQVRAGPLSITLRKVCWSICCLL